jgi:hypothetical protein
MNIVEQALWRVKRVLSFASLVYSFVNALIALLAFSIVLSFFSISLVYALILTIPYFLYSYIRKHKKLGFGDVEERIPELEWRLRTSADNKERTDDVASSLHHDVMQRLSLVKASKFLSSKHMISKFATVFGLIVLLSFFYTQDITFKNTQSALADNPLGDISIPGNVDLEQFLGGSEEVPDELSGEETIPQYGDKEEILELSQMKGLVDIGEYDSNNQGKTFTKQSTGTSGNAVGSGNSQEKISDSQKSIVENYFKRINQKSP